MTYWLILLGLIFLLAGGDLMLRAVSQLAMHFNISKLVIGLVIVGFGTSLPELFASLNAARYGAPGIAIGNVVGSNIANILLILGMAALLAPVVVDKTTFTRDFSTLLITTVLCMAACLGGTVTRLWGALLFTGLCGYLLLVFRDERRRQDQQAAATQSQAVVQRSTPKLLAMTIGGLCVMLYGADLFIVHAIDLASALGVTKAVIGLTIVAVGTSLPELVTAVMAALRKETDIAFGNIIGSNIFNVLGILGVTSTLLPLQVPENIARLDIWIMAGAVVLLGTFAALSDRIGRAAGLSMLAMYVIYVAFRVSVGSV